MIRRESERSNDEDAVFHKEDPASPVANTSPAEPTSPKSPKSFKDEPLKVVMPAPPPKENAWSKRKDNVISPRSSTGQRTPSTDSPKEPTSPKEQQSGGGGGHHHEDREKKRSSGGVILGFVWETGMTKTKGFIEGFFSSSARND